MKVHADSTDYSIDLFISSMLDRIKAFRIKAGINQSQMGRKLSISQAGYGKIESGASEITVKRLFEISEILEIDILTLLNLEKLIPSSAKQQLIEKDKIIAELEASCSQKDTINKLLTEKVQSFESSPQN